MKKFLMLFSIITVLSLTGCADRVTDAQAALMEPVGFWYGVWHGYIVGFAALVSLFDDSVIVYATYHKEYYDLGFYLGVMAMGTNTRYISGRNNG